MYYVMLENIVAYGLCVSSEKFPNSLKSKLYEKDIVIATPGRLCNLLQNCHCHLDEVSYVVLDEVDQLLEMGFENEVLMILKGLTCTVRQTVMFSATRPLPLHVLQLAENFLSPWLVKVDFGSDSSEDLSANRNVMQIVEVLEDQERDDRLKELFKKFYEVRKSRVLVFVLNKEEESRVKKKLSTRKYKAVSISGVKEQHVDKAYRIFQDKAYPPLIATDVAVRKLHIPDVEVVINYSFPLTIKDYVDRIGRTGQAGKKGVAYTFFTEGNKGLSDELINVLKKDGQVVPLALLKLGTNVKKGINSKSTDEIFKSQAKVNFEVHEVLTHVDAKIDKLLQILEPKSPLIAGDSPEYKSYEDKVVTPEVPGKHVKNDKRKAGEAIEQGESKKKQKKNVDATGDTLQNIVKKREGRDDFSSSESEDKQKPQSSSTKSTSTESSFDAEESSEDAKTSQPQTSGSNMLYMSNLTESIRKADVENFFEGCGKVVDVSFVLNRDGTHTGRGIVKFATVEAANRALGEKQLRDLVGHQVHLDLCS